MSVSTAVPVRTMPAEVFTALPAGSAANIVHRAVQRRWIDDLFACVDLCAERLPDDLSNIHDWVAKLEPERRWSPVVYYRSVRLHRAMMEGYWTHLVDALQALSLISDSQAYDTAMRTESLLIEPWEFEFVDEMRRYLPRDREGRATLVGPVFGRDAEPHVTAIQKAIELFAGADPMLEAESAQLVCQIKFYQGRVLRGESAMKTFGAMYIRTPPIDDDAVSYWLEHIVHEAAHHYAMLLQAFDGFVTNPRDERYSPPIRRDPRPMVGIFHATYVLARMVRVFRRLVAAGASPAFEKRLELFRSQYAHGFRVISEHGRLTALGERIVGTFEACCEGEPGLEDFVAKSG